jgi:hypothetical protein
MIRRMLLKLALVFLISAPCLMLLWVLALAGALPILGAWIHLCLLAALLLFPIGCILLIAHFVARSQRQQSFTR